MRAPLDQTCAAGATTSGSVTVSSTSCPADTSCDFTLSFAIEADTISQTITSSTGIATFSSLGAGTYTATVKLGVCLLCRVCCVCHVYCVEQCSECESTLALLQSCTSASSDEFTLGTVEQPAPTLTASPTCAVGATASGSISASASCGIGCQLKIANDADTPSSKKRQSRPPNRTSLTQLFPDLVAGTYTVTATSAQGCTSSSTAQVTARSIAASISSPTLQVMGCGSRFAGNIFSTYVSIVLQLCGESSTTLTATTGPSKLVINPIEVVNADSPGPKYSWSTGQSTSAITVSSGGTYTVTITDAGCTGTSSVVVTSNAPPSVSISPPSATLCSGSKGGLFLLR